MTKQIGEVLGRWSSNSEVCLPADPIFGGC